MINTIAEIIGNFIQQAIQVININILPGVSLNLIITIAIFLTAISFIMRLLI